MQNGTMNRRDAETPSFNELTERVIGACIEIHRAVGAGVLLPIDQAQMLAYLKLSRLTLGLLINFNVPVLKSGIKCIANHFQDFASPRLSGEFRLR